MLQSEDIFNAMANKKQPAQQEQDTLKAFFVFLWPKCIRQFLSFRPNGTANKKHWGFKRVASISKPHTYSTFLFWRTKENKLRLGLDSLSSLTSFKMRLVPSGMRARA